MCELEGNRRAQHIFAAEGEPAAETELSANLSAVSIDPQRALEEYLHERVHSGIVYRLLFQNRLFEYLTAATPGLRELLTMGKLWELAQLERRSAGATPYDLVIVDAPATGHGIGLLEAPKSFRDAAGGGPIRRQANRIHSFFVEPSLTAIVAVSLAEELPVTETLELRDRLRDGMGVEVAMTIVNGVHAERFSSSDLDRIKRARDRDPCPELDAALEASRFEYQRALTQAEQLERLGEMQNTDHGSSQLATLPVVFSSELDVSAFEALASELEHQL